MHPEILKIVEQRFLIANVREAFNRLSVDSTFQTWKDRPHAICYYGSNVYGALVRIKGLGKTALDFQIPFFSVFHGNEQEFHAITKEYNNLLVIVSNPERIPLIFPHLERCNFKLIVFCKYYNDAPYKELIIRDDEKAALHSFSDNICVAVSEFSHEGNRRFARAYIDDAGIPVMAFPWGVNLNGQTPVESKRQDNKVLYIGTYYEKALKLEKWFRDILHTFKATVIGPDWSKSSFKNIPNHVIPPEDFDDIAAVLYSSHTISLNLHHDFEEQGYSCNERTFNSIALGGFQVSDRVSRISEFFDDSEIVTAATPEECFEKTRWYIDHPDERYPFMIKALDKVYRYHTYHHRLIDLLSFIFTGNTLSQHCPVLTSGEAFKVSSDRAVVSGRNETTYSLQNARPTKILYCFPEATNPNHYAYSNIRATLLERGYIIIDFDFLSALNSSGQEGLVSQLRALIDEERPDIFWHGIVTDELPVSFLDELRDRNDLISIVFFSDDDWRIYNHSLHWVRHYNFATTNDINALDIYRQAGCNHVFHLQYAANPRIYYPREGRKSYDVTFVGQGYLGRPQLIYKLLSDGLNIRVWGTGWDTITELKSISGPRLPTEQMIETVCASKIVLGLAWCSVPNSAGQLMPQIKGRTFEYPACRAFQITCEDSRLKHYFAPEKEIVTFRNSGELIEKIRYYLSHDGERDQIADAAYRRVMASHTWQHRWDNFFRFLEERLALSGKGTINSQSRNSTGGDLTESGPLFPTSSSRRNASSPLVSIYCFVYNGENYITQAIESVLNQTYENIELIILNDGSTDATEQIIKNYLHDPRIKYRYQENIGRNLDKFDELNNRAIDLTSGEYICAIGADDVFLSDKIDRQLKDFEQYPELDISFCNARLIDADGNVLPSGFRSHKALAFNRLNLLRWLFTANFIPHPSTMIKRKAFYAHRCYETSFAADYHFWMKTAKSLNFKYVDEMLWYYRVHGDQSTSGKNAQVCTQATYDVQNEIYEKYTIDDFYPEIGFCSDRDNARYSAHLDFGNEMIAGSFCKLPLFAVREYKAALACRKEGIEALNNCAIASVVVRNIEDAKYYFDMLRPYAPANAIIAQNIDVFEDFSPLNPRIGDYKILSEGNSELKRNIDMSANRKEVMAGSTLIQRPIEAVYGRAALNEDHCRASGEGVFDRPEKKGLTSIIVVLRDDHKHIKKCIKNIQKHTPDPYEIILVSSSKGKDQKWLQRIVKEHDNYTFLDCGRKTAQAGLFNEGIKGSVGEYIVLLSDEMVVTDSWLSDMRECLLSSRHGAIVGPMTNDADGLQKVPQGNYQFLDHLDDFARTFRQRNRHKRIKSRYVNEFCMLFRHDLIERIGLFDENLGPHNSEDEDFCLRAALEGHDTVIAGDVYLHRSNSSSIRRDRGALVKKWVAINKGTPSAKKLAAMNAIERAQGLFEKGQEDQAITALMDGIAKAPDEKSIYHFLSESLIELKRHKDALDAVDSLTEEVRLEEKSLELTAYAKEGLSLDAEAEVLADKLLSLNSQSAFALNLKGILSHKRGDKRAAEDFFQRSIENDPGYGEPCTNYGKLKWATQQDEALELLEKGFILSPIHQENATAYYNAVSSLKKFERAALVFEEAKALHPHNKRIRFLLIGLLIHHNDFNSAMQEIEDALILFGNDEGMLLAARQIREKVGPKEIDRVSQKRGTLSVCMIVKNEEQHIARSLHSLSPVADEFIVVDTGSMDKTADVARIFGAKVFDFTWTGNFAEARNFSLAQASGRWVLVHDADEVLSLRDHTALRAILLRETPRPKAYSVITRNYTMNQPEGWIANVGEYPEEEAGTGWVPTTKVRLFVNDPRIRFEGHVHECVEPSLLAAGVEIKNCAIPIHHYGRLNVGKTMAKAKEYYQLGIKKLEEGGEHPRSLRELAIQAGELGKHEEAIELWKRLINLGVTDETLITALFNTGSCYFLLGKYEDSLATSKRVMELAPRMKENILTYACSELCIGDVQKAIAALTDIAEQGTPYPPALAALMVSHMITGKKEDGVALMNKLHGMYVSVNEYLYAFAQYMKKAERLENAVILLEAAIETGKLHQDTHALLAECRDRLEAGNVSAHLVAQHNE